MRTKRIRRTAWTVGLLAAVSSGCGGLIALEDHAQGDAGPAGMPEAGADATDGPGPDGQPSDDSPLPETGQLDVSAPDAELPDGEVDAARDAGPDVVQQQAGGTGEAIAYQMNPAHTGAQPGDTLGLPLTPRWSTALSGSPSYAIASGSNVYVTTSAGPTSKAGLVALDAQTGVVIWGPKDVGGSFPWANAAYDNATVFVVNSDGFLYAFDATTGTQLWLVQLPGQSSFSAAPTASGGAVYVSGAGSGGTLYAVAETTGAVMWTGTVLNGDTSSPAVDVGDVFVSYACNQTYGFTSAGAMLWHHQGSCEGGGGATVAVSGGVYTRDSMGDLILKLIDGSLISTYTSQFIPAFAGQDAYYVSSSGVLSAVNQTSFSLVWSFASDPVVTAPITVGQQVVAASSSKVYAFDAASGTLLSSTALAGVPSPNEGLVSAPLSGLSEAAGRLYVPAGSSIVAY